MSTDLNILKLLLFVFGIFLICKQYFVSTIFMSYKIWFIIQILLISVKYTKRKHDFPQIYINPRRVRLLWLNFIFIYYK
jgi:hypothetical protein